ncbi:formimidoylglutamate deiminase [Ovoidimarina sediminis]|uniref:formimidoylglutamate deiminase n=1 Tax=Ovoidimarina sediminis TaxID=3079856 RepID=UPI002906BEFF|nr:formimidoylglutamate deiminase [Rhodophyticola sp. MJ-SS7]MDU8944248.1 formimidoylglutamate deiminase [Rhodophyticola sp. MJ-SS7]
MQHVHARQALTPEGWAEDVAITIGEDGRIASVRPGAAPDGHVADLVLPAPVNLHSHSFQRAMSGLTETRGTDPEDSFWTWRRLMYRFLEVLTPEHVEAIAAEVFMESLEAGYGAIAEFHYLHHGPGGMPYADVGEMSGRIVRAAGTAGIALTLLPVYYARGGADGRDLQGGQRRFGTDADRFAALIDAARVHLHAGDGAYVLGVAPHSLRAADPADLGKIADLVPGGPVHIHVAEQTAEVDEIVAHLGARPVEWLLGNAEIGARWCLIHATHMSEKETSGLAKSGAVSGLCPITEANLGDGIFNGAAFQDAGGRYGVGSDSNVHIALFEELAMLEYSQRLHRRRRAVLATPDRSTGRVLFEAAAGGGAQAAARDAGAIRAGAQADLLGLGTDNEWICARSGDAALDSLIFGGHGRGCIRDVWSGGRHVVQDGRHIARDRIVPAFRKAVAALAQAI